MYVDLRMASTSTRNFKTPYEMTKGSQPTVSKLHRFYTLSAVNVPKARRKKLAKEGTHTFAEAGRFVGFHAPFSSTYAVMLSESRLVHSINVTFDDSDFRVKSKPKLGESADRPFEISTKVKEVLRTDPSYPNDAASPYDTYQDDPGDLSPDPNEYQLHPNYSLPDGPLPDCAVRISPMPAMPKERYSTTRVLRQRRGRLMVQK